MPRQYPTGGSYRGQYNSYQQQPTAQQYESFYKPIPIDFLQNQLDRRQGKYDTAFAGTIAAKEQMAAQQAALQDLGAKNEIIGDTMSNIDKTVEEKYGGDWGRAAKEIAGMVSSARQNPFWESTKHLKEQQGIQQQFQLNNPNAWVYQDTLGQSTIDPETGRVRDREALTFRGSKRSNTADIIEKQYADMTANITDQALKKVTANDIKGMLTKDRVEQITSIEVAAAAKAGVGAFLTAAPDYMEGHLNTVNPDTGQKYTEAEVRQKAEDDIYSQIQDKIHSKLTSQVMRDPEYVAPSSKIGPTTPGVLPEYISQTTKSTIQGSDSRVKAHEYASSGKGRGYIGRNLEYQAQFRNLTKAFEVGEISAAELNAGRKELIDNHELLTSKDKDRKANRAQYWEDLKVEFPDLAKVNPDTNENYTMEEGFAVVGDYYQEQNQKDINQSSLNFQNSAENVNLTVMNTMNSRNWKTEPIVDNVTGDVYDKDSITEGLGFADWQEMQEQFANSKVPIIPKIDYMAGNMTVQLPASLGRRGNGKQPIDVSFDIDLEGQSVIEPMSIVTNQYYDTKTYSEEDSDFSIGGGQVQMLPNWNGQLAPLPTGQGDEKMTHAQNKYGGIPGGYQGVVVVGTGSIRGNNKEVYLINYGPDGEPVEAVGIRLEDAQKMTTETMDLRYQNIGGQTGNPGIINK